MNTAQLFTKIMETIWDAGDAPLGECYDSFHNADKVARLFDVFKIEHFEETEDTDGPYTRFTFIDNSWAEVLDHGGGIIGTGTE